MLLKSVVTFMLCACAHAAASSDVCSVSPTKRDAAQGLAVVTDAACGDRSGVGCITTNCRYCRLSTTSSHDNLLLCSALLGKPPALTPTPPAMSASSVSTADPCALAVSPGDLSAGVSAATDRACATGGLGCFSSSCRFCSVFETTLSASFLSCTSVSLSPVAPLPPPPPAFDLTCRGTVSSGDAAAGIDVATDLSCALSGVGCLSDVCRFCQVWATAASHAFVRCSAIDTNDGGDIFFTPLPVRGNGNGIAIASTDRPVLDQIVLDGDAMITTVPPARPAPPAPLVSPTSATTTDACAASVSTGDAAVGISAASDPSCQFGGLGCYSTRCRFCKVYDTPQSFYLLACTSLSSP